jgi:hypothetical protein
LGGLLLGGPHKDGIDEKVGSAEDADAVLFDGRLENLMSGTDLGGFVNRVVSRQRWRVEDDGVTIKSGAGLRLESGEDREKGEGSYKERKTHHCDSDVAIGIWVAGGRRNDR